MNAPRRNLLLVVFAIVVGGYFINLLVNKYYFQPLEFEARSTTSLEKRISEARLKARRLLSRMDLRDDLENRSLPAEIELATSSYQTWLINLVSSLGLINPNVDSTSPVAENGVTRLQFTIRGKANLKQLTKLLFEFYRSGSLQKIRSISLTPTGNGDHVDIQISVEALSLRRSRNDKGLSTLESKRLRYEAFDEYAAISKRNLFGEGTISAGIRAARLTAVTSDRLGVSEAWISLDNDSKTLFLKKGESVQIDAVEVTVKAIQDDSVTLELDGQSGKVGVGKSLSEIKLVQ